jgi:hypothetical protein
LKRHICDDRKDLKRVKFGSARTAGSSPSSQLLVSVTPEVQSTLDSIQLSLPKPLDHTHIPSDSVEVNGDGLDVAHNFPCTSQDQLALAMSDPISHYYPDHASDHVSDLVGLISLPSSGGQMDKDLVNFPELNFMDLPELDTLTSDYSHGGSFSHDHGHPGT